jgi:iron complex outermembrane recepter protein
MKIRKNRPFMMVLGQAIGAAAWIAASPAVMAQQQAQEYSQKQEKTVRKTVTGSNIARVTTERTLPLLVLDRAYIDQSGATTATELIQTLPQAQSFRIPAPPPRR